MVKVDRDESDLIPWSMVRSMALLQWLHTVKKSGEIAWHKITIELGNKNATLSWLMHTMVWSMALLQWLHIMKNNGEIAWHEIMIELGNKNVTLYWLMHTNMLQLKDGATLTDRVVET